VLGNLAGDLLFVGLALYFTHVRTREQRNMKAPTMMKNIA